jgi:tetratricopeptide (TPR) repeat protein
MRPLNFLALMVLLLSTALAQAAEPDKMAQADALMQSPTLDFQQAGLALDLYAEQLAFTGANPASLVRLARTAFVAGDLAPNDQRARFYEKGLSYAERLLQEEPHGVAGHYWKAMNMCGLADVGGRLRGFRLLPHIIKELQESLALDEAYDQAGAHRVLGRIYYEAPAWPFSVGDPNKSLQHLTAAARLAPENSTNHLYLAETLLKMGNKAQARDELEKVLQPGQNALHPQAWMEDRREARRLLEEIKKG